MVTYRYVHMGPNTQLGGFQEGLVSDWYQDPGMKREPTAPAVRERTIQPMRGRAVLLMGISKCFPTPDGPVASSGFPYSGNK